MHSLRNFKLKLWQLLLVTAVLCALLAHGRHKGKKNDPALEAREGCEWIVNALQTRGYPPEKKSLTQIRTYLDLAVYQTHWKLPFVEDPIESFEHKIVSYGPDGAPLDGWSNPFGIVAVTVKYKGDGQTYPGYCVRSAGPDGVFDSSDDLGCGLFYRVFFTHGDRRNTWITFDLDPKTDIRKVVVVEALPSATDDTQW